MNYKLENSLSILHDQKYAFLLGNATTALFVALNALGLKNKRIAIPNSVCVHVPIAIYLSGNTPHYLDISKSTLGIDLKELKSFGNKVDAVIAVHAYGAICDIIEIGNYCKTKNIPLIEDLAVSQGSSINNQPVGSFSDIAVVSFGSGKVIDVGHGGALLTSNKIFIERINYLIKNLEFQEEFKLNQVKAFNQYHTDLYNIHFSNSSINNYSSEFKFQALSAGKQMICKFDEKFRNEITTRLNSLDETTKLRKKNYEKLEKLIRPYISDNIEIYKFPKGSIPWRLNIFIDERNQLLKRILSKKIKVSSWFPSVDTFFENRNHSKIKTPVSDKIADRIINFWINEEIDDEYFQKVIFEIKRHLVSLT